EALPLRIPEGAGADHRRVRALERLERKPAPAVRNADPHHEAGVRLERCVALLHRKTQQLSKRCHATPSMRPPRQALCAVARPRLLRLRTGADLAACCRPSRKPNRSHTSGFTSIGPQRLASRFTIAPCCRSLPCENSS